MIDEMVGEDTQAARLTSAPGGPQDRPNFPPNDRLPFRLSEGRAVFRRPGHRDLHRKFTAAFLVF